MHKRVLRHPVPADKLDWMQSARMKEMESHRIFREGWLRVRDPASGGAWRRR